MALNNIRKQIKLNIYQNYSDIGDFLDLDLIYLYNTKNAIGVLMNIKHIPTHIFIVDILNQFFFFFLMSVIDYNRFENTRAYHIYFVVSPSTSTIARLFIHYIYFFIYMYIQDAHCIFYQ